jgi:hypothetical protein
MTIVILQTVAEMWAEYREKVVPKDAGPTQIRECRVAFYAGAHALLQDAWAAIGDGSVEEEAGLAHVAALVAELGDFARDIVEGRA